MAQFFWREAPAHGACNACGSSQCERGFVNMLSDAIVHRAQDEFQGLYEHIAGIVDVYYCATCIEQASALVGCSSMQEQMETSFRMAEQITEIEHLKDEVLAERERFQNLVDGAASYREGYDAAAKNATKGDK